MESVFSHIVRKRLSQEYENVATEALAYILETSEAARHGMYRLLRGIVPDLPAIRFETQQTEDSGRPDMRGFADADTRVFVENKFWAGLTENQPVFYLERLAAYPQPSVLLVIAPASRADTLRRELARRLLDAEISYSERDQVAGITWLVATHPGPLLALTSWTAVLSALEHEAVEDQRARGDLVQLSALCDAAEQDAFVPISAEQMSDQRLPALILQLVSVVDAVVERGAGHILSTTGLRAQANARRIGRYVRLPGEQGPGAWFGVHFRLWKLHGTTPFWLKFSDSEFGKARDVRRLIESWAARNGKSFVDDGRDVALGLSVPGGDDKDHVIRALMNDLDVIGSLLAGLQSPRDSQPPAET